MGKGLNRALLCLCKQWLSQGRRRSDLFLTIAGSEALDVFDSFQLTQTEEAHYEAATERFEVCTALHIKNEACE